MIYVFPRKKTAARKRKNKISRLFPHIRHSFRKKNYCFLLFAACSEKEFPVSSVCHSFAKNLSFSFPSFIRKKKKFTLLFRRSPVTCRPSERKRSFPFFLFFRLSERKKTRRFSFIYRPFEKRKLVAFLSFVACLRKENSSLFFHLSPV